MHQTVRVLTLVSLPIVLGCSSFTTNLAKIDGAPRLCVEGEVFDKEEIRGAGTMGDPEVLLFRLVEWEERDGETVEGPNYTVEIVRGGGPGGNIERINLPLSDGDEIRACGGVSRTDGVFVPERVVLVRTRAEFRFRNR